MASSNENAVTVLERQISGWSRDSNTSTLQQASLNQTSQLVIGIDFGTTYTAVAFAHSKASLKGARVNLDTQAQLDAVLEKIIVIKNWPNASQQYAEKTPSIIAYEGGKPTRWGGQIMRTDKTKVSCFKLGLQEGARQHYQSTDNAPLLGGFLNDCNWKHPDLPSTTAADFAADYLSLVGDFVMNHVLRDRYGDQFLRNQQISYAITVPAIWSDKARDVTRRVAERAGIPEDKLTLVTEPEAAAQYCATICGEVDLQPGDHFLVCDAGGGTVDLIAYKVRSLEPFEVEECTVGTGATCGAMYLNDGFERLVRSKLGSRHTDIMIERRRAEVLKHFDSTIKCQFNPLVPGCEEEHEIPLHGVEDILSIGLEAGFLTLSKEDIDSVFTPIFEHIQELVRAQISKVWLEHKAKVKTVFMVGGFGSNEYLSQYLASKLPSGTELKKPVFGWTAITRGAVLHMLGMSCVRERVIRRHYGVVAGVSFIPGVHPESKKTKHLDGKWYCGGKMRWYARKGEKMSDGHCVKAPFFTSLSESQFAKSKIDHVTSLHVCDADTAPEYYTPGDPEIRTLIVDLKNLPSRAFQRKSGPDGVYYDVSFELAMKFGTILGFEFLWEGNVVGAVAGTYF